MKMYNTGVAPIFSTDLHIAGTIVLAALLEMERGCFQIGLHVLDLGLQADFICIGTMGVNLRKYNAQVGYLSGRA